MQHRAGVVSLAALTAFVCCGATSPEGCQPAPQPTTHYGAIAGGIIAGVVVGTVVLVAVHHSHHTLTGCVFVDSNGLHVRSDGDDPKTYTVAGGATNIKVGDRVKLHGSKVKRVKGNPGEETFVVEKISHDYGPCKVRPGPVVASATPTEMPKN